ncbi:MAG: hypothetical protein ACLVBX_01535 [Faecalibacterium prausnitzii]
MNIMGSDYDNKYVWIAVTATEGGNVTAQARNLLEDVDTDSNINSKVANDKVANGKKLQMAKTCKRPLHRHCYRHYEWRGLSLCRHHCGCCGGQGLIFPICHNNE